MTNKRSNHTPSGSKSRAKPTRSPELAKPPESAVHGPPVAVTPPKVADAPAKSSRNQLSADQLAALRSSGSTARMLATITGARSGAEVSLEHVRQQAATLSSASLPPLFQDVAQEIVQAAKDDNLGLVRTLVEWFAWASDLVLGGTGIPEPPGADEPSPEEQRALHEHLDRQRFEAAQKPPKPNVKFEALEPTERLKLRRTFPRGGLIKLALGRYVQAPTTDPAVLERRQQREAEEVLKAEQKALAELEGSEERGSE